jgi:GINS complex subunit 1
VRAEKVQEKVWQGVDVLGESAGNASVGGGGAAGDDHDTTMQGETQGEGSLSPEEGEYVRGYAELLAAYKGRWTDIDLTGSLEPPRDLFVDVRVLKDAGEIQTEYGAINLTKNSQFYVRQGDVERLIAQGYLQKLS